MPAADDASVLAARLRAGGLRSATGAGIADVVGRHLAVQAQEFWPALWGLSRRVAEGRRPDAAAARRAFDDGEFLRTHVLRPTWHVVRRDDVRWLLELSAPRVAVANAHPIKLFEVDARFDAATDVLAAAVEAGPRTRAELAAALTDRGMAAANLQLGYLLMRAELDRALISGPVRGRQQTYAAFDARATPGYGPLGASFDRDAALAELVRRYLATRAYATVKDMSWWSGMTMRDIRHGLDLLGAEVVAVPGAGQLAGLTLWRRADVVPPERAAAGSGRRPEVDLLQAYDELFVSFSESRRVVVDPRTDATDRLGAAIHVVAVDGRVAGRWKWTVDAREPAEGVQWLRVPSDPEVAGLAAAKAELVAWRASALRAP